ncbi:hypothetical protein N7486_007001 [Penicillium sp. IBT 16267x]|nr:hypothetical protein N7486_007001 [Penicillium sp. IBT 16267x]
MPRLQPIGLYSLSFILVALASTFPSPDPTPAEKGGFRLYLPEPTPAPEQNERDITPRDYTDDSTPTEYYSSSYYPVTTSTSWVPASVCSYIDGIWFEYNSTYCGDNRQCIFHTADSIYPGLVGCCDANYPSLCSFETTCYDADAVSATPDLTDELSRSFATYCTESTAPACQTWTYPELSITDYGCAETANTETVYLSATSILDSTDSSYYEQYPTVAAVSPSLVDDDWINVYVSGTAATATTDKIDKATSAPASSTQFHSTTAVASSDTSNKGSSADTAAIVGGVVGGVVGAAGIGAAVFMFWLLQKKRKQKNEDAADGASQPALGGNTPPPHATTVIIPPQEVDGNSYQKHAELDGYTADLKFGIAEVAGSSPDYKPQETESQNFVAELPAPLAEQRSLSSNTSRPCTPEGRRS